MKVLKFGGTSVGTVESLTSVKKIVEGRRKPVIIVVSALGGVTDMLISTAKAAAAGEEDTYLETYAKIIKRHHDVIEGMVPDHLRSQTFNDVDRMLDELGNIFKGVSLLNDLSSRSLDTIVSYGERLSSLIISRIIKGARLFDSRQIIKTVDQFGKHVLDTTPHSRL